MTQHTQSSARNQYGEQTAAFLIKSGKAADMAHARKIQFNQRVMYAALAKARGQ